MSSLPAEAWKLEGISPRAYQHPADRAATAALQKVPYLDAVVRKLIGLGYERALRAFSAGASVRLGADQLPAVWALHREAFNTLDIPGEAPPLYVTARPIANAFTVGADHPIVVVNSELLALLPADGKRVVLAHEAAHVHGDHVLYQTGLLILLNVSVQRLPMLAGLPLMAIRLALMEWFRAAELSCDRAAALVTRDPMAVCRALMTLTAGTAAEELNLDAFVAQAAEYDTGGGGLERLTKLLNDLNLDHPMPVRRVRELMDWVRGGDYDRIVGGDYIRVGDEPPLGDEAVSAQNHYGERLAGVFEQAGSSITEVGEQLGNWLKRDR